jgi:hypothetical protein
MFLTEFVDIVKRSDKSERVTSSFAKQMNDLEYLASCDGDKMSDCPNHKQLMIGELRNDHFNVQYSQGGYRSSNRSIVHSLPAGIMLRESGCHGEHSREENTAATSQSCTSFSKISLMPP